MTIPSRRTALALGLGVLGLVGRAFGQAPGEAKDKEKAKETGKDQDAKPGDPSPLPPGAIGTVDMNSVMKGFGKVREATERFQDDAKAKRAELIKMIERARRDAQELATLQPGTPDHADLTDKIKKDKEAFEAARKQADAEYSRRQADMLGRFQQEIQEAIAVVARRRGLVLVLRALKPTEEGANLGAVVSTISREVLYVDARADLTEEVITLLNNRS